MRGALVTTLCVLAACGARTGLPVPEGEAVDGGRPDAGQPDAGTDAGEELPDPDECIELPFEEPPEFVDVRFNARIQAADVLLLVDVTGSMSDEIAQIRNTLREVIIPEMVVSIPDLRLSVASFADFPVMPYGAAADRPFRLVQASTADIDQVQLAVGRLREASGGDGPESQIEALYQSATGAGRGAHIPPADCPEGTVGYPCFRGAGSRIVLLFTDAEFHNGPGDDQPYEPGSIRPTPASYEETVNALRGIGAKVAGLFSGGGSFRALEHLEAIARDTGAVTPDGEPIVFDIGTRGERLDTGVIESVQTLVEEVPIDIDVLLEDYPGDGVDARDFVQRVIARAAEPPGGATIVDDRFENVTPGTTVTFRVRFRNDSFPETDEPQVYFLTIVLRGDGVVRLTQTTVAIVVPGRRDETCMDLGL